MTRLSSSSNRAGSLLSGALEKTAGAETVYGPMVLYDRVHGLLKLVDEAVDQRDTEKMTSLGRIAAGDTPASAEGIEVFRRLADRVPVPGTL